MNPKLEASLIMIPSAYKEDKVYSIIPQDRSGDLTFTRASDGTRVNSAGYIERVPWNLLLQSNTFSTTWILPNATVTSGQTGYDGSSNAWLLSKSASGGRIYQNISTSGVQTLSVYAKAGSLNWLSLWTNIGTSYFNLATGTKGSTTAGTTIGSEIESVGNGWYRCSFIFDTSIINVRIYPADGDLDISGTSGNIYIQDAQLVEGSTAKPYFPTTDRLNVPRLDYSGGCPSLLLEPQRTNLRVYSEQINSTNYSLTNVTSSENTLTSPDGTINADKIIESTSNSSHAVLCGVSLGGTVDNSPYCISVFAKAEGRSEILFYDNNQATGGVSRFNLSTGVVVSGTGKIENYGNGWYRCTIFCLKDNSTTANIHLYLLDSAGNSTYTGNGTSGIGLWGYQVEAGSYATSYIPTTSASVTRVADEAYKTGISSLIGQSEGVLFVDFVYNSKSGTNRLSISDGTTNNWIFIGTPEDSANDGSRFYIKTNGSVAVDVGSSSYFTIGQRYKLAIAYKSGDWAVYGNGTLLYSGTSSIASVSSPLSVFNFFSITGVAGAAENINQTVLFKTRLTNAELAALTTL